MPAVIARVLEAMTHIFEQLSRAGLLDDALPKLTGLPILYSPNAGKGAKGWLSAYALYREKKVGTKAPVQHRGSDKNVARISERGQLAEPAVRVVRQGVHEQMKFKRPMEGSWGELKRCAVAWAPSL